MAISVYFAGAIKGDTTYEAAHSTVLDALSDTKALGRTVRILSEKSPDQPRLPVSAARRHVFIRDKAWLDQADALIAEVSGQSFGTGWEIAYSQEVMRIPVLCLAHRSAELPALIVGNTHKGISLGIYDDENDLRPLVNSFMAAQIGQDWNLADGPGPVPVIPSELDYQPFVRFTWFEGGFREKGYELRLCAAAFDESSSATSRQNHIVSTMCSEASREVFQVDDATSLFKFVTKRISNVRRAVFVGETSHPSTDLGWMTAYAQWKNVQTLLTFHRLADVSWLILGQTPSGSSDVRLAMSEPIVFRGPRLTGLQNWLTSGSDVSTDSQKRERPPVVPIPFESESDLLTKVQLALREISVNYQSTEIPKRLQDRLAEYAVSVSSDPESKWSPHQERRFLAECVLRDALWRDATARGIGGSFLSGERTELIRLFRFHDLSSSPRPLYRRIRHAINYEEKAFAKNVRAMKDIGILLRVRRKASTPKSQRDSRALSLGDFGIELPMRDRQSTFEDFETITGSDLLTFVSDRVLLTRFGGHLSDYLNARRPGKHLIETVLLSTRETLLGLLNVENLYELVEGRMEYLLDALSENVQEEILSVVDAASGSPPFQSK